MGKLTRRQVLENSLFTAAAAAALPAAAQEKQPAGRVVGPNDQIRVAVIGVNGRGMDHVSGYNRMKDVTIATICDVDLSVVGKAVKAVTAAGKPEPKVVQDLRRVLDDPNIDAVSIATPNHWHSLAAIWAMQAGKDVYVEKPVSHNVHEGRVMVDTARKYNRICQAGTQCRSMQGTIDAIEYVRSGKIGKVSVARGLCYKPRNSIGQKPAGVVPTSLDYNLWVGPAEMVPYHQNRLHYNWHWVWNTGNGDLGNQGIHQMDIARWGLGKNTLPNSVIGFGGRLGYVDDGETPNTHVTLCDYGDSQLIFETRGLPTKDYRGAKIGVVFHGADGDVVLTSYNGGAAFDKQGKQVQAFRGDGDHYRNFIDCMRTRNREALRGEIYEGHVSSALCHLGNISYMVGNPVSFYMTPEIYGDNAEVEETYERTKEHLSQNGIDMASGSYRLGTRLKIDPTRERFINNEAANNLLSRRYRAPFVVPDKA